MSYDTLQLSHAASIFRHVINSATKGCTDWAAHMRMSHVVCSSQNPGLSYMYSALNP